MDRRVALVIHRVWGGSADDHWAAKECLVSEPVAVSTVVGKENDGTAVWRPILEIPSRSRS